ncbi:MAG: hypothetical protein U9R39_02400 [Campylobacterota bacterium]|nr:hypothetical protein [Campylobacterota bacterium]
MSETIDFGIYKGLEWEKLSTEYLHGLSDMGNIQAQDKLKSIYDSPIETQIVGFGKFSGNKWIDLDVDYLYWIIDTIDTNGIKYMLASRALKYIEEHNNPEEFTDVIYVD